MPRYHLISPTSALYFYIAKPFLNSCYLSLNNLESNYIIVFNGMICQYLTCKNLLLF